MIQKISNKKILSIGIFCTAAILGGLLMANAFGTVVHPESEEAAMAQPAGNQPLGYIDITYNTDSIKEVGSAADSIIIGKVLNKTDVTKFDEKMNVDAITKAKVQVEKVLKGSKLKIGDVIEVQAFGNSQYVASNGADLELGKKAILFISQTTTQGVLDPGYYVYGQALGEYKELPNGKYHSKYHGDMTSEEIMAQVNSQ